MLHFGWYCILGTLVMRCGRRDTVQQEAYKKQESITGLQFLTELPNFVLVLASAVVSHSLIVWLDFVDTLGNLLSEAIVAAQSRRMSRDLRYEYNYGVGKIEALTTFFTDAIELGGLLCIAVVSVMQLISPESPMCSSTSGFCGDRQKYGLPTLPPLPRANMWATSVRWPSTAPRCWPCWRCGSYGDIVPHGMCPQY